jgi:hypothetical protein
MAEGGGPGPTVSRRIVRWVGSLVGIAGVAMCITLMGKAMGSVLAIGGACASGNSAYVIQNPCPNGVPAEMLIGIFGGLAFTVLFLACVGMRNAAVVKLLWTALFLGLGLVFLGTGIPWDGHGAAVTPIIIGAMFVLMGVVPLFVWLPQLWKLLVSGSDDRAGRGTPTAWGSGHDDEASHAFYGAMGKPPPTTHAPPRPPGPPDPPGTYRAPAAPDVGGNRGDGGNRGNAGDGGDSLDVQLAHLAELHTSHALSDAEFIAAKEAAIRRGGG